MKVYRVSERFTGSGWVSVEEPCSARVWDEGFGPVWVVRDTMGVQGFVRARTWEEAWACAEDAIFPDADPALVESCREPGDDPSGLPEGFGYRNNGPTGDLKSYIYAEDLNGQGLDVATPKLLRDLGYRVSLVD